jgi:hypothetical protein
MSLTEQTLGALSQHRLASAKQLSVLVGTSEQMVRTVTRELERRRKIKTIPGIPNGGRPEKWFCLTEHHRHCGAHDWYVTQVEVALTAACPSQNMTCAFRRTSFPRLQPDFTAHISNGRKTLLFFGEVCLGTEPLTRESEGTSVFAKFERYIQVRECNAHAVSSEEPLGKGFRVLVVGVHEARYAQIVERLRYVPGDFIWVTSMARLEREGASARVWSDGKREEPRSIFHA